MTCEIVGRIVALCLGYMPAEGQTVFVPKSCERKLTLVRRKAESCAAKHGIRWRFVEGR